MIYVPPLFEEANQHRHVFTKLAQSAVKLGVESIIYDPIGTGDSQKDLVDISLAMWQEELTAQIVELRANSTQPIVLCMPTSSVLLLTADIVEQVDALQLWQPEFNGKKFVQQFKRIALAQQLSIPQNQPVLTENPYVDIAGYYMQKRLLEDLSLPTIDSAFEQGNSQKNNQEHTQACTQIKCINFEWLSSADNELTLARKKQYQQLTQLQQQTQLITIAEPKYWQATSLTVPQTLLVASLKALQEFIDG